MTQRVSHWVVGLGTTGLSVVKHLCARGLTPAVCDTRLTPPGAKALARDFPKVPLICGDLPQQQLSQARQIILSPGLALSTPAIAAAKNAGVEVIGDIELFARARKPSSQLIGITGSNGKSTVTSLVGEMLASAGVKVAVGGNIGTPALDLLEQDADIYVLELSSFQLETCHSLNCTVATILNVSEDHLDRYPDYAAYLAAKRRLYQQTQSIVANFDDPQTWANDASSQVSFGLSASADWNCVDGQLRRGVQVFARSESLTMLGRHNQANALAAMALIEACGLELKPSLAAMQSYPGLEHRCQTVATVNGVRYVNDSKATNVGATLAALEGLADIDGDLYLILGGDSKQADLSELAPALSNTKAVYAFGKDGDKLATLSERAKVVANLDQAVSLCAASAKDGDIVLLSPACASLDMYPNFMARGEHFCQLVGGLNG